MKLMKEKAEQLLQRCEVVVITSSTKKGIPACPHEQNQIGRIFRGLDGNRNDSLKTKDFRLNPKAGLCYSENGNSVALTER